MQDAVIKKLKKYVDDPSYTPETVAKQSRAAMSLCMWSRAMDVYHRVAKVVEPKKMKLREAEGQLAEANRKLAEKQKALRWVGCGLEGGSWQQFTKAMLWFPQPVNLQVLCTTLGSDFHYDDVLCRDVEDRVNALKRQLNQAQQEQKDLNDMADITKKRLERAGKLTGALADEGVRWQVRQNFCLVYLRGACWHHLDEG